MGNRSTQSYGFLGFLLNVLILLGALFVGAALLSQVPVLGAWAFVIGIPSFVLWVIYKLGTSNPFHEPVAVVQQPSVAPQSQLPYTNVFGPDGIAVSGPYAEGPEMREYYRRVGG